MLIFNVANISTHTPLARRDFCNRLLKKEPEKFLLTRLSRGATRWSVVVIVYCDISTHTPLARRDFVQIIHHAIFTISTHTPLARRDQQSMVTSPSTANFYSHASREARQASEEELKSLFCNFYSHASREARLAALCFYFCIDNFYSHASREARQINGLYRSYCREFLLTRLSRGATP